MTRFSFCPIAKIHPKHHTQNVQTKTANLVRPDGQNHPAKVHSKVRLANSSDELPMADEEEDYEDIPMMAGEVGVDYAAEERELELQV